MQDIGDYLSHLNSVIYESNLMKGDRIHLSFKDAEETQIKPDKEAETIELSNTTIADILGEDKPVYCDPVQFQLPAMKKTEPVKPKLQIVDYSERAFAVIGETKQIKDLLQSLGGSFNKWLKCGEGWIFSKKHLSTVKMQLAL